jgi:very-short-patch-repair endonuclease
MQGKVDTPHAKIAAIAYRQHGVIAIRQLREFGFSPGAVENMVRRGRLHRIYRGVYAVGHARISRNGRFMAAVLACGDRALLSHRSAGWLWGLRFDYWRVEVTAAGGPKPIVVHRTRRHPSGTTRDAIPVTSLGRTLVDLADVVTTSRLERAFEDAERLELLDVADVQPIAGRRGLSRLQEVLASLRPGETKSEMERRFKQFLRDEGFPWPLFNTLVEGILVDAYWPDQALIIELDSWEFHGKARKPFEDDREKSNRLQLAGYRVMRITSRMLDQPDELAAQLALALSRPVASASGPARS